MSSPQPLWAEQWPEVWLEAAKASIRNTVAKSGVDAGDIKAIAISGLYGGSGIPLDGEMKPVRPCMIWMDRRAQRESDWVLESIGEQRLLEITHNGADPYRRCSGQRHGRKAVAEAERPGILEPAFTDVEHRMGGKMLRPSGVSRL